MQLNCSLLLFSSKHKCFFWFCGGFIGSCSVLLYPAVDFKLKDFLKDDETLSHFLHRNASLPHHALKQIVEADVNLEKVGRLSLTGSLDLWEKPRPIYKSADLGSTVRPRDHGTANPLILTGGGGGGIVVEIYIVKPHLIIPA